MSTSPPSSGERDPPVRDRADRVAVQCQRARAKASAGLYSLIETAKANGREPYGYLCWLLERLPSAGTAAELDALLPWSAPPSAITPT